MGAFYSKQPNGLICRFSSVVDAITDYNMTEEEFIQGYVEDAKQRAEAEAKRILKYHMRPFQDVLDYFQPREMSQEKFDAIMKEMNSPCEKIPDVDEVMTAEDTLQRMADFYDSIFPTRKHALNHLFCVIGNGYDWIDGRLVDGDDEYESRYKLQRHVKRAEFKGEDEWNRFHKIYADLHDKTGAEIPFEFNFSWYPMSEEYSALYTAPENITPDWKALLEECRQLLIADGVL